ncbi:glutamate receptor ionotropic, delta-2 [Lucilia sericata]|uniref:glutamate receptor ionotropic, delta-2 n=1 Tax=Lucilia sericata TaxID=13632 RepID=UPI0018A84890|nr:glutamate receptor ionotropic, delta-2 [Lucilia sericata]
MVESIVNPDNETARMVIYLQKPTDLGPRTWLAGISCLDRFTAIYFKKREVMTRPPNIVLTSVFNMSTPAAQIQEGFLKLMMEAISETPPKHKHYQFRIVSDSLIYLRIPMSQRELVLADYYIIVVDSVTRLKALMRNNVSNMLSWNPGARFIILYNNVNNYHKEMETARLIFEEMLYNFYVHRVALMYATSSIKYSVLLMDYYNETSCRHLEIKSFATCQEGRFKPENIALLDLQLQKFVNSITLNNCTFYMCASIAAPFIEADCLSGLELRIIGFIKSRLKFNINQTCERESRGVEEKDGNWSGLLGRLNERSCDFIVGGFYPDNDVIQSFWVSDTYLDDSYTWFIKLADPRPPWMALYAIFKNMTWLACILMLILTWITWFILVNFLPEPLYARELSLTGINNLAVTICVSANERPICGASRIFFIFLALYGLNLTSTYTSKLIAVFANPGFLHQIDNLQEVKEAGIPYGGLEESRDWFENDEDMWIFDDYNDTSDFEPTTVNLEGVKIGERVLLSSRMYILQNALSDDIYAFPYNVFSSPMQMIMKPGFPFLYDFNRMIRYMRDFGIFKKIQTDFIYNNTYLNRINKMRPDFQEIVIVLTTQHLQGPFAILILGIMISTVLFLGELLTFYIIQPCWQKHQNSTLNTDKTMGANSKKKKREKRKQKKTQKSKKIKLKKPYERLEDEIVIPWSAAISYDVQISKGIRFTPLKRRIIDNRENIVKSD